MNNKELENAEKLREDILSRLKEVESKLKAVQQKLSEKGIPDMKKEDFLNFQDILNVNSDKN